MDAPSPLPQVTTLPRLDTDQVARDAHEWVDAALAGLETAEARARAAADLEREEGKQAARYRKKVEAAVHTLTVDYKLRRGAGLAGAIGVPRSSLMVIRRRAAAAGHEPVPDAPKVLPRVALRSATHAAREEYAREARDAAVVELSAAGWTQQAIGELIGRDRSRVSHISHRDDQLRTAS